MIDAALLIACVVIMVWLALREVGTVGMGPFLFAAALAVSLAIKLAIHRSKGSEKD